MPANVLQPKTKKPAAATKKDNTSWDKKKAAKKAAATAKAAAPEPKPRKKVPLTPEEREGLRNTLESYVEKREVLSQIASKKLYELKKAR